MGQSPEVRDPFSVPQMEAGEITATETSGSTASRGGDKEF